MPPLSPLIFTLALAAPLLAHAQARPLNDTGATWSGHATSGNAPTCNASHPAGQDCRYGRDKAAADGALAKVGASSPDVNPADPLYGQPNGFDFTKIANNGTALPHTAALDAGAADWACTRDNVTGLVWEVKTTSGLRSLAHRYTWYDSSSPAGSPGTASGGTCATAGRCDTEKYVADVNAAGLCGAADWRMPTVKELEGIADLGRSSIAIDPHFFPHTIDSTTGYWSGTSYVTNTFARTVGFSTGESYYNLRNLPLHVRLVRRP